MAKPKITETDISKLTPDPNNARKRTPLSASVIRKSIEQFGMTRSIVTDENGVILAGNGAFEEAGQLGIERVIVVETTGNEIVAVKRTNLTAEQKTQYAIADNTASDFSTWDYEILEELASDVDLSEFFPDDKLNELLESLGKGEGFGNAEPKEENEEEVAELLDKVDEIESRVKLGEIWECGRHRIACGDSTIEGNVKALLGDRFDDVGMVWSDCPYGMDLDTDFSKMGGKGNKYDKVIGDDKPFDYQLFNYLKCKEQFWFGADYYAKTLPCGGSWFVWDKYPTDINEGRFGSGFELIWSLTPHKRDIIRVKSINVNWETVKERCGHPTQKPVALCEWFFEKYGKPDDLILDPFLGSAPSIIAAEKMEGDRTVYGFELSPQYCTIILERFQRFTGIEPKLVGRLPD